MAKQLNLINMIHNLFPFYIIYFKELLSFLRFICNNSMERNTRARAHTDYQEVNSKISNNTEEVFNQHFRNINKR